MENRGESDSHFDIKKEISVKFYNLRKNKH